jgi:hypothetical protein
MEGNSQNGPDYLKHMFLLKENMLYELDGHAVSALRHAIAEVKQRCSVIGWVTKIISSSFMLREAR